MEAMKRKRGGTSMGAAAAAAAIVVVCNDGLAIDWVCMLCYAVRCGSDGEGVEEALVVSGLDRGRDRIELSLIFSFGPVLVGGRGEWWF